MTGLCMHIGIDKAEQAFNFHLLSHHSEAEKREVQDLIHGLSAK